MTRPHPYLRPPASGLQPKRSALTLVEVLLAMGLLTLGLLGVASIFPVGGRYAQLGDIADQGGAVAQAALDDAVIEGYLDPENWIIHQKTALSGGTASFVKLTTGDGQAGAGINQLGLGEAAVWPSLSAFGVTKPTRETFIGALFGGAIVIDPLGLAGVLSNAPANGLQNPVLSSPMRRFPATIGPLPTYSPYWQLWMSGGGNWPVRRATVEPVHYANSQLGVLRNLNLLRGSPPDFERHLRSAEAAFTSADDPALVDPASGDDPVRGRWETWQNGSAAYPSSRQSRRDYSWLFTIAPGSAQAVIDWASPPYNYPVEVSSVVFHKRVVPSDPQSAVENERLVRGQVITASPGGGELRLIRTDTTASTSPFEELRPGNYVMVVAPHPSASASQPVLALRWCRVLRLEGDTDGDLITVALRSSDWPWLPSGAEWPAAQTSTALSDDLRVAILPGVVAVHTKTMRLESSSVWGMD
ncbi:hypothetical protein [Botrimarina sp.]|uniref:hypothetical protein n=1 Tax=Botrimarina sp. TaxID=2795802 RepID=UPI0032EFEDF3